MSAVARSSATRTAVPIACPRLGRSGGSRNVSGRQLRPDLRARAVERRALPGFGWRRACGDRSATDATFPAGEGPGEASTPWTTGACTRRFSG